MSEHGEKKCVKCGSWWPKSYLLEGLCWNCDGRYEDYKREIEAERLLKEKIATHYTPGERAALGL